jgi:cytochrome c
MTHSISAAAVVSPRTRTLCLRGDILTLAALTAGVILASLSLAVAEPPPDYRFKVETLASDMTQPLELEVAPDGRIFFNELNGKLKVVKPGGQVLVAATVPVFNAQENGLLGFALDPKFRRNQHIFIFYSPTNLVGQRLSRFVMKGDQLDMASEKVVLEFGTQRKDCCHHAGSVEFAPDGNLFISTGDNTHPGGNSDGYAPIDERPGKEEYDAQDGPANTHDLRGKILRIRPTTEGGYTIPDGNLFPKDGSQGRPEIYVMGCRNPWRMSVDQKSGVVYWGEVGPDAGGDGPRGPRGYDEINQARRPGNFGWPFFVGSNFAYARYDFATKKVGAKYDALRPVNDGRNNTGSRILPPAQPAFIYWPYGDSKEFPSLGGGGRTACAGPVFHFKSSFKQTGGFPEHYDNCLLFYDWQRPFIRWARLDAEANLKGIEPFPGIIATANTRDQIVALERAGKTVVRRPVDSQFGEDGCLYLLDYGETWGANKDARLLKISYQWGNIAPVAQATVDHSSGREPLTVALSGAGSFDHEKETLRYEWLLHPAGKRFSTEMNPRLTISEPGNYVVELRVKDARGATASASLPLVVGNSAPIVRFLQPQDGDFFTPGRPVSYSVEVRDPEEGSSADFEEIFEARTFVNAAWSRGDGQFEEAEPGLAHMKQSDCFNCHAIDRQIVGPPLLDIAAKYRGQEGALETAVTRVIKGSSKVWSEIPMLPHEALNPDQVRMMVRWIFALEPGKSGAHTTRGLLGKLAAPSDDKVRTALLEASYTDGGKAPAGSLSGRTQIKLRSRRMQAEAADLKSGLKVVGGYLGSIDDGHFAKFERVHLGDCRSVTVRVASGGAGGQIEFRQGSVTGPLLASLEVQPTGGWEKWLERTAPLRDADGRADVFIVFRNPGKGGLLNLDWVQFNPPPLSAE